MTARIEKIGLFGGSFDPIHAGHLILAQAAVNVAGLDRVLFIPTAVPPHKAGSSLTGFEERARMVELAIAGNGRFELSLVEASRTVSYTYRTVRAFAEKGFGRDALHLLIGSDSLEEMGTWRRPAEIFARATILVMMRPGHDRVPALPREAAVICVASFGNTISSTEIRSLVREGQSIRYLVPEAVEQFILERGLYGAKS